MKLTTKSEYALLALIYMARNAESGFVKIEDICARYDIPKKYLEQLFYILKGNGYIKTKRGINGGYRLAKMPDKITIAEIVRLMDGALAPDNAVSEYFYVYTKLEKEQKLIKILKEIRDFIASKLENLTLNDLI